ncbi:MAG: hypothetical protein KJ734_11690, partial [Chloroflexi bacterium]|nr:hypothetical protein [Chloroflexota bacterium]
QGWREIVACRHWDSTHRRPVHDRVAARADVPLFQAMTAALVQALQQAIAIYDEPGQRTYAGLILGGFEMLDRFTWERAVLEYEHAYDRLCV